MKLMDTGGFLLSRCPRLAKLQRLELIRCRIEPRGVVELAETRMLPALTWLDLSDNWPNNDANEQMADRMAAFLATSPLMNRLTHLYLNDNELTSESARALAESASAMNLTHLELGGNHIGDRGIRLLMEAFPKLLRFNVAGNPLSTSIMIELKEQYGDRVHLGRQGE
jgi:Leucine-rich repeat (LRR) protein